MAFGYLLLLYAQNGIVPKDLSYCIGVSWTLWNFERITISVVNFKWYITIYVYDFTFWMHVVEMGIFCIVKKKNVPTHFYGKYCKLFWYNDISSS